MLQLDQAGFVVALTSAFRERGSWAGETHVQKASYFLQCMLHVPLNGKFILYKHGPFSFDLRGLLSEMEAAELVQWEAKPFPYGPSLAPSSKGARLVSISEAANTFAPQIAFVAERLANKKVTELERLATALYVSTDESIRPESWPFQINKLKPHVSLPEAEQAVDEMRQIRADAIRLELVVMRANAACS